MSTLRTLLMNLIGLFVLVAAAQAQIAGPPPVRSFADSAKTLARPSTSSRSEKSAPQVQKYATKNRKFTIPFSMVSPDQVIVEVHLFVSSDRGQHWEPKSRADQRQPEFQFEAPEDGEYWFAVQTLNRNGQRVPVRIAQPELIVVVDTSPPTIEARSSTDNVGRVIVEWSARDSQLATESFSIRQRPAGSGDAIPWIPVPAKVTKAANGPLLQDSYAFWPESNELNLDIEVSIRDQAVNQATTQTTVQRTQTAPQFAMMSGSTKQRPPAAATADPPNTSNATASTSPFRSTAGPARQMEPNTTNSQNPLPNSSSQSSAGSPAAPVEWRSVRHSSSGQSQARGSTQDNVVKKPLIQPTTPIDDTSAKVAPDLQTQTQAKPSEFSPTKPAILVADHRASKPDFEPHSVLNQPAVNPELSNQPISVNTKRFRLNYQVEAIDPAGVKEVAVWTTRDDGKSWARLGSIPDPQGPFPVEVDESGLYGFRLVVISHSGLKSRLPQPGDPADKWVRVDVDPPIAKITSAPSGTDDQAGKLVINWDARDDLLALRPIELSFSTRPDGPWTTIEKGLRNTGSYAWAVPADAPERVYLRLTVRDEAGNEQVDQTSYAVDISNLYPRGRIQSVEPINDK